jgi:hypothetical protein
MLPVFFQHFAHKVGSTWSKFHAISIAWALKKSTFDSTPRLAKNNICAQCTGKKKPNGEAQSYCDYNIISFVSECCESYFLWSTNILPLIASRSLTSFQQTYKFNPGCWLRPSTFRAWDSREYMTKLLMLIAPVKGQNPKIKAWLLVTNQVLNWLKT